MDQRPRQLFGITRSRPCSRKLGRCARRSDITRSNAAVGALRRENDAAAPKRAPGLAPICRSGSPIRWYNPAPGERTVRPPLATCQLVIVAGIVRAFGAARLRAGKPGAGAIDALRAQVGVAGGRATRRAPRSPAGRKARPRRRHPSYAGDLVPADGALLSGRDFFVNQAPLTGESFPVEKRAAEGGELAEQIAKRGNAALAGVRNLGNRDRAGLPHRAQTALGEFATPSSRGAPPPNFENRLRRVHILLPAHHPVCMVLL